MKMFQMKARMSPTRIRIPMVLPGQKYPVTISLKQSFYKYEIQRYSERANEIERDRDRERQREKERKTKINRERQDETKRERETK